MANYDDQPGFVIDAVTAEACKIDLAAVRTGLPTAARALELGCGSGVFTRWLRANGFDATGMDMSTLRLAEARQRLPDVCR